LVIYRLLGMPVFFSNQTVEKRKFVPYSQVS